ncbi:efflux RND transporter periplasmic adaptor subunit [Rhodobacteraceae bacterium M382]|nr:efflux RND transporter periplasmic adaptor subunit [Rhodobacteraceae bacterium M382]
MLSVLPRSLLGPLALTIAIGLGSATMAQTPAAPKVSVAAAYTQMISDQATFIGRGQAIDKVDIRARVNGFLEERLVNNGAEVSEGELLFKIERSAYEATLDAQKANLAKAEANLELKIVEYARKEELFQRGSVPAAERDTAKANEKVAEAEVRSAKAAVRQAELNLSYTNIDAPFDGRIGAVQVSRGDVVSPDGVALVTLVREAPIFVSFALNEKEFVNVLEKLDVAANELSDSDRKPKVYVDLPNGRRLDEVGEIAFADNRIDPTTGTITLRARFANTRGFLIDGAFVSVGIEALEPVERVLIPQAAIQRDQRGDFVLVVGAQNTVEQRYITSGDQVETAVIVEDGLREGESVIVEGLQRVRPGVKVDAVLSGQAGE